MLKQSRAFASKPRDVTCYPYRYSDDHLEQILILNRLVAKTIDWFSCNYFWKISDQGS